MIFWVDMWRMGNRGKRGSREASRGYYSSLNKKDWRLKFHWKSQKFNLYFDRRIYVTSRLWEVKEKKICKALAQQMKLQRMIDVFNILVVEMYIPMPEFMKFVHFKHVQFIVCQLQLNGTVKIFPRFWLTHPFRWMMVPFTKMGKTGAGMGFKIRNGYQDFIVDMLNFR